MINETIDQQVKLANKAIEEMKNQNRIFENIIKETLINAPESDKNQIQRFQAMSIKAMNLAKKGKTEEAQNLIKNFKNG